MATLNGALDADTRYLCVATGGGGGMPDNPGDTTNDDVPDYEPSDPPCDK